MCRLSLETGYLSSMQYNRKWLPTDVLVYFMEDAGHEPGKFMYESMLYRWNDTPTGYYKWKKDW